MQLLGHWGLAWKVIFNRIATSVTVKNVLFDVLHCLADMMYKNISWILYTASRIGCW